MPMFTTPDRSHHSPAMAPSATGVPSRSDSHEQLHRRWCPVAGDRARASTMTRGTKSTVAEASAGRAKRTDRRSKNVATAAEDEDDADHGDGDRAGRRSAWPDRAVVRTRAPRSIVSRLGAT